MLCGMLLYSCDVEDFERPRDFVLVIANVEGFAH
jgi:hypothetical protein